MVSPKCVCTYSMQAEADADNAKRQGRQQNTSELYSASSIQSSFLQLLQQKVNVVNVCVTCLRNIGAHRT